ncbi:MAG: hypothetical protein IJG51_10175 [Synergistaceae bacterium]|nr:hypothetical protein [Synergistaceae bacterium]MBQ3399243.1 hypothetical protein [Synergistaceae bacterium]MBQ3759285.1 hypothetical protein [Synergistaceae bacterium]MBQ6001987.1 hypothetical protein [Synergistaceae bacterium]MBQ6417508.1 hypothetical protein [Synergistaceae bacterium]
MRKILCAILFFIILTGEAFPASNSSEAFLSLPFGHTYARTQKRMENSGAKTLTPRKDSLTMEGMFESYPAMFIFGFYKNKLLKSKAVYLQSMGNAEYDRKFYEAMQKGMNALYGKTNETPTANTRAAGKIMLKNVWTPDRYTTITLTYNPEMSKRFPGSSLNSKFIQVIYKYDKWD